MEKAIRFAIRLVLCTALNVVEFCRLLTLTLLRWTIWRAPTNASKWWMGFNSAFKGLREAVHGMDLFIE